MIPEVLEVFGKLTVHLYPNPSFERRVLAMSVDGANWRRQRSSARSLVNRFTDSFPGCLLHSGLKPLALERRLAKPKQHATFSFCDDPSETLLDVCTNRRPFFCREFLRLV